MPKPAALFRRKQIDRIGHDRGVAIASIVHEGVRRLLGSGATELGCEGSRHACAQPETASSWHARLRARPRQARLHSGVGGAGERGDRNARARPVHADSRRNSNRTRTDRGWGRDRRGPKPGRLFEVHLSTEKLAKARLGFSV